jgi:hypothetical protein
MRTRLQEGNRSFSGHFQKAIATKLFFCVRIILMTYIVNIKYPLQKALHFVLRNQSGRIRKILLTNFVAFMCAL